MIWLYCMYVNIATRGRTICIRTSAISILTIQLLQSLSRVRKWSLEGGFDGHPATFSTLQWSLLMYNASHFFYSIWTLTEIKSLNLEYLTPIKNLYHLPSAIYNSVFSYMAKGSPNPSGIRARDCYLCTPYSPWLQVFRIFYCIIYRKVLLPLFLMYL